jgi:hypothetical protein
MIAICPAGPPKLIKPSLNQNLKASQKLGTDSVGMSLSTELLVASVV